ncbi:MAG: branched-chain amino acid ABC transporter permease [Anaerolineales bacterium]|nr:branched-chain amino acid ABC transporter permease [Anaerolineales bacterium]
MQTIISSLNKIGKILQRAIGSLNTIGFSTPFIVFIILIACAPLYIKNQYMLRLLVVSLYYGILAMAFDFTGGFINAVNFGYAGFVGLGSYTSALLVVYTGINPWLGLIIAMGVTASVGFLTGLLTLPLRGIYVSLMSWFVGLTLMALASALVEVTRGARGLVVSPIDESATILTHLYILLTLMMVIYFILRLIINSHIGLAFKAIGQNYDAACASGVNPTKYKLFNFTLSCACAGLLGGYYAHFVGIVTPDVMDTGHTMEVMALSYIGGSGSLLGGVFAAFLLLPIFDSLKQLMEYRLIIYGMLLILVMIFYPVGLNGLYQKFLQFIKRKKETKL